MAKPHDIREFSRSDRHAGRAFTVHVWHPENGTPFVHSIDIEGLLPKPIGDGHGDEVKTLEDAFRVGFELAKEMIDA